MFKPEGFQFYCMYRKGAYFQTVFCEMDNQTRELRSDIHIWGESMKQHPEQWRIENNNTFGWLIQRI